MNEKKHSHYFRSVEGLTHIDIYRVLERFGVTDPALQHIAKKALCAGLRGHKDFRRDLQDIVDTGNRRIEMLDEDQAQEAKPEPLPPIVAPARQCITCGISDQPGACSGCVDHSKWEKA